MEQLSDKDFKTCFVDEVEITPQKLIITLTENYPYKIDSENSLPLKVITLINHDYSGDELSFKEKFVGKDELFYEELFYQITDNRVFKISDYYSEASIEIKASEILVEEKPYDKKHLWKYLHLYEKALKESEDENKDLQNTTNEIAEFLKKEIDSLDKKLEMLENQNDSRISHWKKEKENFLKIQRILNK